MVASPGAVGLLQCENPRAEPFVRDAGALRGKGCGRGADEVAHRLPADGGIGIEEPVDGAHDGDGSAREGARGLSLASSRRAKLDGMVFVLDNYDSFTFNLVQYMGELGAELDVRRNDDLSVDEVEALGAEKIVLSPGPCTPQEAGISIELIRRMAGKVPILGVCLGHQAIGAAFGGNVVRAAKLMHGKTSEV